MLSDDKNSYKPLDVEKLTDIEIALYFLRILDDQDQLRRYQSSDDGRIAIFTMADNATDLMGYIYTGAFTPGTCSTVLDVEWYTVPTGGTPIGSGAIFDPVGVAGSGLTDTNTAGTTTFWAGCPGGGPCRIGSYQSRSAECAPFWSTPRS